MNEEQEIEQSQSRRLQRAKSAAATSTREYAADDPSRQANSPRGPFAVGTHSVAARRGRGA